MTWFCGGRHKRHNKSRVSSVQYSREDSSAKNVKVFAIVLQNFEASVLDELSVTRGQIVEKLCADDEWIYVRNVDGRCGYIPRNFCYGMEQVINNQQWNSNEVQGSRSITPPTSTRIRVNTVIAQSGSQSSVEVHSTDLPQTLNSSHSHPRQPLRSSTPVTSHTAERLETPDSTPPLARSNRRLSSLQPSAEHITVDLADSAITEEPRYVERPRSGGVVTVDGTADVTNQNARPPPRPSVRRSLSMNDGARTSCRVNPPMMQRVDPIQRSISYQEAVLSAGQDPYSLVARRNGALVQRTSPLNPRRHQDRLVTPPQRISPANLPPTAHMNQTFPQYDGRGQSPDFDPTDDVFLPEPKKPVGIYRCLQEYKPKYAGELSVKEGELVILLEFGRGNWAWVMTSMNQEGLLPRQHLVRYNPRLGVGGPAPLPTRRKSSSNASTQTELIVDGGIVRHASGASSASAGGTAYSASSSSSVTTPQTTPPLTRRLRRPRTRAKVAGRVRERCVPLPAAPAIEPSARWFEDVDSLECSPRHGHVAVTQTTPTLAASPLLAKLNAPGKATPPQEDPPCPVKANSPVKTTPPQERRSSIPQVNSSPKTTPTAAKPPRPTNLNCTIQTTPPLELRRRPNGLATPQSVKSADCFLGNRSPNPAALLTPNAVKSADYAGAANAEFWFNSLSSTSSSIRTFSNRPTLTAVKDYDPPPEAKNCLRLSRGDVLTAQPHMHYPKGWMWVWHKGRRSFGYVPQSHVGYTYAMNRSRSNTVEEDAV